MLWSKDVDCRTEVDFDHVVPLALAEANVPFASNVVVIWMNLKGTEVELGQMVPLGLADVPAPLISDLVAP